MNKNFSEFTLNFEQACILCSIKRELICNDISNTEKQNKLIEAKGKKQWLEKWDKIIDSCLADFNTKYEFVSIEKINVSDLIKECIKSDDKNQVWKCLILLECMLFEPYYPIAMPIEKTNLFLYSNSIDYKRKISYLSEIAALMDISKTDFDSIVGNFESSIKLFSKGWNIDRLYNSVINAINILPSFPIGMLALNILPIYYMPLLSRIIYGIYYTIKNIDRISAKDTNSMVERISIGGCRLLLNCTEEEMIEIISFSPQIVMLEIAKIRTIVEYLVKGEYKDRIFYKNILTKLFENELYLRINMNIIRSTNCGDPEMLKKIEESIECLEKGIDNIKRI